MLRVRGHKYKGHNVINLDKDNKLIKHFEKQSGGYEDEEYEIFIPIAKIRE